MNTTRLTTSVNPIKVEWVDSGVSLWVNCSAYHRKDCDANASITTGGNACKEECEPVFNARDVKKGRKMLRFSRTIQMRRVLFKP